MDKERYRTQVAQSITPLVSSTYSYANGCANRMNLGKLARTTEKTIIVIAAAVYFAPALLLSIFGVISGAGSSKSSVFGGINFILPAMIIATASCLCMLILTYQVVLREIAISEINVILIALVLCGIFLALFLAIKIAPIFYAFIAISTYVLLYGFRMKWRSF